MLLREEPREPHRLRARRLGLDTQDESIVLMRQDCTICRSEGFTARARVELAAAGRSVIATLYQVTSDFLRHGEVGLSDVAWRRLGLAEDGTEISVRHPRPLTSMGAVRAKIYGHPLQERELSSILSDIVDGRLDEIELAAFITACSARGLQHEEVVALTRAMINVGDRLRWPTSLVADKHCVGGLPGNRTTPIVVAIIASLGLTIPKTSSRAITSPAGTADTMETMAPVDLDLSQMRRVVEREGGCIVWGGAVRLSPADDALIRVERVLDLDSEGQLVASVLSKKIAAGATHVVLDLPVGPTAKVRSPEAARSLGQRLQQVAELFGLRTRIVLTDGSQPVGRGIGPALEAFDVLAVLQGLAEAPRDLRTRALALAGALLETAGSVAAGAGERTAEEALSDGRAWTKFQRICEAQGGLRTPARAEFRKDIVAEARGRVRAIDNRRLAKLAKLAGAPAAKASGVELHAKVGSDLERGATLFSIHAETRGELEYALDYLTANGDIFQMERA